MVCESLVTLNRAIYGNAKNLPRKLRMISIPPKTKKMRTVIMKKVKLSHPSRRRAKLLRRRLEPKERKMALRRATLAIKITSIVLLILLRCSLLLTMSSIALTYGSALTQCPTTKMSKVAPNSTSASLECRRRARWKHDVHSDSGPLMRVIRQGCSATATSPSTL